MPAATTLQTLRLIKGKIDLQNVQAIYDFMKNKVSDNLLSQLDQQDEELATQRKLIEQQTLELEQLKSKLKLGN